MIYDQKKITDIEQNTEDKAIESKGAKARKYGGFKRHGTV